ncbi:MAG: response regulator, partial [Dehalococcoidales bacterium]|nr:response regulator [Dehalococcoidales bacterium]
MRRQRALILHNNFPSPTVAALLESVGFRVEVASPQKALRRLKTRTYDITIIINDHTVQTWKICKELRGISTVPIVIIGREASPETCVRALNAGADYFLRKPFGPVSYTHL